MPVPVPLISNIENPIAFRFSRASMMKSLNCRESGFYGESVAMMSDSEKTSLKKPWKPRIVG